jgi:NAD(P)-dependent dehydrogenase (short-subunit alcohol dehydrogenase family)
MTAPPSNTTFGFTTNGLDVAAAFPNSIKGRTILITGVNKKGIGYTTAESFASQSPSTLILAGRSPEKLQECINDLKTSYPNVDYRPLIVDLGSQNSVRKAGKEVLDWNDVPTIDIVINNAGIMNIMTRSLTPEGIEITMATNHVGHFLLTNLLMPKLIAAAKSSPRGSVRIVNLASMGIHVCGVRFSDLTYEKPAGEMPKPDEYPNIPMFKSYNMPVTDETTYFPTIAYGASKTAAVLFSVELNARLQEKYGIRSFAVNPGEIQTELGRNTDPEMLKVMLETAEKTGRLKWKTLQQGCSTSLVAAVGDKLVPGVEAGVGKNVFLSDCQAGHAPGWALKAELATRLWGQSEEWVGENFEW